MADGIESEPYWWRSARPAVPAAGPVDAECDVAIVGAGYTGLGAALTLARAGRSVQVFDRDAPGAGASSRNGGITSGNLRIAFSALIERCGLERARRVYAEGVAARRDLAAFIEAEGIDCDFRMTGRFTGAVRPEHYESGAREADLLNRHFDTGATAVPRSAQTAEIGTDLFHGGILRPDIGGLDPARFVRGYLDRATAAGARVHGGTAVLGVARDSGGLTVSTSRGTVRARDVIVATNGYGDGSDPWLRRRIVPVPSRIVATEPLSSNLMGELMPTRRMYGNTFHLYAYFRPSPDGTRLLYGGRDRSPLIGAAAATEAHRRSFERLFPALRGIGIAHSWNGYVAFSRDDMPRLFERDGVHYACGYCGSGVVWARWLGIKAANRVLGRAEAAESMFAGPPPRAVPLYRGRPWFLPAAIGWLALKDRLGR